MSQPTSHSISISTTDSPPSSPSRVVEFLNRCYLVAIWMVEFLSGCYMFASWIFGFFRIPFLGQRHEDVESSDEFFDLESLSHSSEDFFDALSQLSEEEFLSMFSTGSEDYIAPPEAAVALAEEIPPIEITYFPWLTITIAAALVGMFMIMMGVNNCPKHTIPPDVCFPAVFGRFSLQPTDQNSKYGPSRATLIKMGGLYFIDVLHIQQAWRLLSNIWLHEGLIPLLTDITILLAVGVPLERKFRFARVGSLYLISGLGGSLASSLFYESSVTIGASGALAGLAGGTISKSFIEYWTLHLPMGCDLLIAVVSVPINVAITMFEHGDNFANLGGLIVGVLFGFIIFTPPPVNGLRSTALLIITLVGLIIGMVLTLKGVNLNDHCSWCHYLDCFPLPGLTCKYRGSECQSNEIGKLLYLTCTKTGKQRIFPLTNGMPPHPVEELCFRLCHADH